MDYRVLRQQIIRDSSYNIIETVDNEAHIIYNIDDGIIHYKMNNLELQLQLIYDINSPQEQEFIDIMKDVKIMVNDKIPYNENDPFTLLVFRKDNMLLFEYHIEKQTILLSEQPIWLDFNKKYSMDFYQTWVFLTQMAKKHFNGIIINFCWICQLQGHQ